MLAYYALQEGGRPKVNESTLERSSMVLISEGFAKEMIKREQKRFTFYAEREFLRPSGQIYLRKSEREYLRPIGQWYE